MFHWLEGERSNHYTTEVNLWFSVLYLGYKPHRVPRFFFCLHKYIKFYQVEFHINDINTYQRLIDYSHIVLIIAIWPGDRIRRPEHSTVEHGSCDESVKYFSGTNFALITKILHTYLPFYIWSWYIYEIKVHINTFIVTSLKRNYCW